MDKKNYVMYRCVIAETPNIKSTYSPMSSANCDSFSIDMHGWKLKKFELKYGLVTDQYTGICSTLN